LKQAVFDPVFEELQSLMRRREELDCAIAALERIRLPGLHLRRRMGRAGTPKGPEEMVGYDLDLSSTTLTSAIVTVLERACRPLSNAEIVDGLVRGGLRFRGCNPPLAVAQALSRMVQKPGAICKLGRGCWTTTASVSNATKVIEPPGYAHETVLAVA
jgi:hypothetical protein